jgi:hypothetical protein
MRASTGAEMRLLSRVLRIIGAWCAGGDASLARAYMLGDYSPITEKFQNFPKFASSPKKFRRNRRTPPRIHPKFIGLCFDAFDTGESRKRTGKRRSAVANTLTKDKLCIERVW